MLPLPHPVFQYKTLNSKTGKRLKPGKCTFDFGGSCAAAIEMFGEDVVYSNFTRASVITAQAAMRRMLEAGKGQEEIQAAMNSWKPGVAIERTVDPVASVLGKFGSMSPEEQKALIKQLQQRANG